MNIGLYRYEKVVVHSVTRYEQKFEMGNSRTGMIARKFAGEVEEAMPAVYTRLVPKSLPQNPLQVSLGAGRRRL